MRLFQKVKISSLNGTSKQFRVMGIPILQYDKLENGKTNITFPFLKGSKSYVKTDNSKPVFYLKLNRRDRYAFVCLQHWIRIVDILNADFYIICDNKNLELDILRRVEFRNSDIKFLHSYKNPLKKIVTKNISKRWRKAAYAHLTTFLHAKKNKIENFWNIDADDTMLLVKPQTAAEILGQAANYAQKNDLSTFSLDMWRSRTEGKHWSFGVTYTRQNIDYFSLFNETKNSDWQRHYEPYCGDYNLDCYFTYIKDFKNVKNESFYIENLHFIHWGDFLYSVIGSYICFWKNGKLNFPILSDIYKNNDLGTIQIASDCIKLDYNLDEKEYLITATDSLTRLADYPETAKRMFCIKVPNA